MLLGLPTTGMAASDVIEMNDTSKVVDLDEVVVVSQSKETARLRLQPVSSSVFGTSEMNSLNVRSLQDLSSFVPSFAMPKYGSRLTSSIYMRGTGSRMNAAAPSVPVYYDHIPLMSKSAFNTHFYMLDRVDVLRGPQATLYGMNSEGGLVRIYSKDPMSYQGTDVNIGIGSRFQRHAEIAHYHRPTDNFAFTVAGFYNGQNGFFNNTHLNERNDEMNEAGAKLRLKWKTTDRLTIDLTSDYQYTNQTAFPYGLYDEWFDETYDPATTTTNNYRRQMVNTGLNIYYDLGCMLLTSTTSHQYLWDRMNMDQDYVPEDYMHLMQEQKMNALTQELALRSNNASRWQQATGLFFAYEWLHTNAPVTFGEAMGDFIKSQWGMPAAMLNMIQFRNNQVPGDFHTPQLNFGVFHESNISITDRLKATIGLRYDYSQVKIDYDTRAMFDLAVTMRGTTTVHSYLSQFASSDKNSYHQLLPKFGLTYTFGHDGSNVYGVVSKGYRAGGYNLQMFSDIFSTEQQALGRQLQSMMTGDLVVKHNLWQVENVNRTITYEPEESWNYEVGSHLNLFGSKVKADVSLYYAQIRNQQLLVMAGNYGYGRAMVNAGKSYSLGAEVSLRGSLIDDHLTWGATYSFTRAKFKEYDDSVSVGTGRDKHNMYISYRGNYVPFIPQHMFSAQADYRVDLGSSVLKSLTFGLNVQGKGKIYWEADNDICQNFYATLGAHAALNMGRVVLDVWGRNLTGTKYNTFLVNSKLTNQNFAQRGLPAQFGIDVRMHF